MKLASHLAKTLHRQHHGSTYMICLFRLVLQLGNSTLPIHGVFEDSLEKLVAKSVGSRGRRYGKCRGYIQQIPSVLYANRHHQKL